MENQRARRKLLLVVAIFVGVVLLGSIGYVVWKANQKNPYGEEISIQGYQAEVEHLPERYEDIATAALYKMVQHNSSEQIKPGSIKDAKIRTGTATQQEIKKDSQYAGTYIVDIESLKQSYSVQYTWSSTQDQEVQSGYTTIVSCLPPAELRWGDFDCKNLHDSKNTQRDQIIDKLPRATFSYKLWADTTSGKLILYADLRITDTELSGNAASRRATVARYKAEVTGWIKGQGFDPASYRIIYNYSDDGSKGMGAAS